MKLLLILVVAAMSAMPLTTHAETTATGTCAITYGPAPIPGDPGHLAFTDRLDIPPGTKAHWHAHPTAAEYITLESGTGWLETEGKPKADLARGRVYLIAPGVMHRIHNSSKTAPLVFIGFFVATPGTKTHTVLKKGEGPSLKGCVLHF